MYSELIKPMNIVKIMLMIIALLFVSITLQETFSIYVDSLDYEYESLREGEDSFDGR